MSPFQNLAPRHPSIRHFLALLTVAALASLAACEPSQKERKQIGGKGQEIQLTWEEEQLRGTTYGIDREGNPPPLQDCEERAWKNIRALKLPSPTQEFSDSTGDTLYFVGQYAYRVKAGYGGYGNNPTGGNALLYARFPDFSPQYSYRRACNPVNALRDANGNIIDGSSCRRYDVEDGVANLVAIRMQCIDRGNAQAGYGSNVDRFPDLYWPARLVTLPEHALYSPYERGDNSIAEKAWRTLTPRLRQDLGLVEWLPAANASGWPKTREALYGQTYYTPLTEPKAWHLGQPIVFSCNKPFDAATAVSERLMCQGPAYLGASFVAPGLTATMSFPAKFLPRWRELTAGFTQFVTSYQTTDPQAPPSSYRPTSDASAPSR
jgi:hypothetical protein